jgi:hypothetical protein
MRRTTEFDAFGPWTDVVRSREDVPRLYRPAGIDPALHRLVLKVPRDIERRNATPDMHLYDFLIAVDGDGLTILRRPDEPGDHYDTVHVPADQITALENSISLLDGRLILHTFAGPTTISYNATDPLPIRNLVNLLRQLYLPAAGPAQPEATPASPDLGPKDLNLISAGEQLLRAEPGMRLITATRRDPALPAALGWTGRLVHLLRPMTLHAAIVFASPSEIELLHRRERLARGNHTAHSVARTILPRRRITDVHVQPCEKYRQVNDLTIILGRTALSFPVAAGAMTDALLDLCAPSS